MVDNPTRMAVLQAVIIAAIDDEEQQMKTTILIVRELEKEEMSIPNTPYHDDILTGALKAICEFGKEIVRPGDMTVVAPQIVNNPT
uniref:Uncharacterized protein n=1 Tax=Nelumbo nucifera TaxID=4432 RepID=A0A822XIV1_NELNU|nr:TPA_asm: hypothetical protein HUJ06_021640 [Nelumbo nucifera]